MNEPQSNQTVMKPNTKRRWAIAGIGAGLAAGLEYLVHGFWCK